MKQMNRPRGITVLAIVLIPAAITGCSQPPDERLAEMAQQTMTEQAKQNSRITDQAQAVDKLERYLGKDIPLVALTKGEGERWHRWIIDDLKMSPNTAGQNVKRCRHMLKAAIDDGLLERNLLSGIKIDLSSDKTKNRYIDADAAKAILEACPDQEWRVIFSLARFGGLRCPSEVLRLRWSDINWERGRFKVHSSKTERAGKGERIVPLFPELRAELSDLSEIVQLGIDVPATDYVIKRYRHTEQTHQVPASFGRTRSRRIRHGTTAWTLHMHAPQDCPGDRDLACGFWRDRFQNDLRHTTY